MDSTNTLLKKLAAEGEADGSVVIAQAQTAGRGRMGRSFHSPAGAGLYMSVLLRPGAAPAELTHLSCTAAVAVCRALERLYGLRPQVKWPNDILIGGKKLCGILTEMGITAEGCFAVVGVGINCRQREEDFPPELRDTATSLALAGVEAEPEPLAAALIREMRALSARALPERRAYMDEYRRRCAVTGREIRIISQDGERRAFAEDVDDDGALLIRENGELRRLVSGEVSVRAAD